MNYIRLQQTLPDVFAGRDFIHSEIWHQDITFQKGEMYLIEADSGTGKSSLCNYIYGYRKDYQGIINFDETNIRALSIKAWNEFRKHSLSMLFQDLRIFPELTTLENILLKNKLTSYKKKKEILSLLEQTNHGRTYHQRDQATGCRPYCNIHWQSSETAVYKDLPVITPTKQSNHAYEYTHLEAPSSTHQCQPTNRLYNCELVRNGHRITQHTILPGHSPHLQCERQFFQKRLYNCHQKG